MQTCCMLHSDVVWDIQRCHMGLVPVARLAEHNSRHTTAAVDDDDGADATTRSCRMVSTCSHKSVYVTNQLVSSKTMVLMHDAKDDDDNDDCCFSKTCNKHLGVATKMLA